MTPTLGSIAFNKNAVTAAIFDIVFFTLSYFNSVGTTKRMWNPQRPFIPATTHAQGHKYAAKSSQIP